MSQKTLPLQQLTKHLLNKYGAASIVVADYWDADNSAIGLADATKQYTAYISDNGRADNRFFVSLEHPPTGSESPYSPGRDFDNLSATEVERVVVKHLKI